jgi:hypothetical protein
MDIPRGAVGFDEFPEFAQDEIGSVDGLTIGSIRIVKGEHAKRFRLCIFRRGNMMITLAGFHERKIARVSRSSLPETPFRVFSSPIAYEVNN